MTRSDAESPSRSGTVLVKGTNGLGNRLLTLLSAILYAKLAGRRVVVDWRDGFYADPGVNAFPLLFRSESAAAVDRDMPSTSVAPWMWDGRLHLSAKQVSDALCPGGPWHSPFAGSLFSFDPRRLDHPADVIVTWSSVHFIGQLRRHFSGPWKEWGRLGDDAILARLLREELEFHPEVLARAEEVRRSWPGRPRIGVHVRNTDRTTNLRCLHRRLEILRARNPDAGLFLATDDAGVEREFHRRYPDVVTVPKWFAASGPLHKPNAPCPDRLAMARASLVDMRLLAGCDHLVVNGNSSFSQMTRLLWSGDPRRVVDVASWAWLPAPVRDRAWRARDGVRWMRMLRRARGHIDRQRPVVGVTDRTGTSQACAGGQAPRDAAR